MAETEGQQLFMEEWNTSSSSMTATIAFLPPSVCVNKSNVRFTHIWRRILQAFVPEGFPSSVTPDYVPFQIWDTLQGLSTYIRTMLSTQALLSAIGVGEKSATVLGATFQWFLRDLTGMIGGILFTLYQGSNLDSNAKMWRLVADLMNDLGMMMDLVSPLFPSLFIFVVCLGSLSRSFTGVASGATRAALTQHFALQNNAADISAKEGSQETVATITGMAIGMLLARFTINSSFAIWFSFLSLTIFHMYANYKAVRCLALTSLNTERCSILAHEFIKTGQILSPQEVSKTERILPSLKQSSNMQLGVRVSTLNSQELVEMFHQAQSRYMKTKYVIFEKEGCAKVVLHNEASPFDVVQAFVHGIVVEAIKLRTLIPSDVHSLSLHDDARFWMDNNYQLFLRKATDSGWKTGRLSHSISWRATWRWQSSGVKYGKLI